MRFKITHLFIACGVIMSSCSSQDSLETDIKHETVELSHQGKVVNQEEQMQMFAQSLSKAVYNSKSLRAFLKEEAMKKFDNDYDVFYPFTMEKIVDNKSFKDIIIQNSNNDSILSSISDNIPLLNIHIPEMGEVKVGNMDIESKELPVLLNNKLYLNGEIVDSLSEDEIPAFHTLVVCQNSKLQKNISTRSSSNIKDNYSFVSTCFDPNHSRKAGVTRSIEYDEYNEKYDSNKGIVPENNIDPELIEAYKKTLDNKRGTRYLMYYNLNNIEETPKSVRTDISDCIFRFKIATNAFTRLRTIAEGEKNILLFKNQVEHKKTSLSREEVINALLTGRSFCFLFQIQDDITNNPEDQRVKIYARPDQLFNLYLIETKRHQTMFRHRKYTYTIDFNKIKPKWFYPMEHDQDSRLDRWDISKDPLDKNITVYLINPDADMSKDIEEKYTVTYLTNAGAGLDFKILKEIVNIGITGNLSSSNTVTKEYTSRYKVTQTNEMIDRFKFNFFNDYPIEEVSSNGYVVPIRKGKGIIETSILPISNHFYTIGIRNE